MLRLDRLCIYVIIFGLASLIPSIDMIKFLDELCAVALGGIAFIDCIFNGNWRKYTLLWILILTMTLSAVYSLTAVNNNIPIAIFTDWIIELKPFIPFIVVLCIGPKFTDIDKTIICYICWINSIICIIALLGGISLIKAIVFHHAYAGCIIFISAMYILYCSMDSEYRVSKNTLIKVTILLTCGLLCTRSKYYGTYVLSIYFLYMYRPGIMKHFSVKHAVLCCLVGLGVIGVAWNKIEYYFLTGGAESFDPSKIESFARPVLYTTAWMVLWDYFPFGSGLASLASNSSAEWYSNLYYEYGINNVHGLSPNAPGFICDAFYPTIAQLGIIGLFLFVWYWIYTYNFLRTLIRKSYTRYKVPFSIGSLLICYILIECVAGTVFTQNVGMIPMMLLGMICATGKNKKLNTVEASRTQLRKI